MQWLRDYFNINRRQERGMWLLMLLLLMAIVLLVISPYMFRSRFVPLNQQLQAQLDSIEWELSAARKTKSMELRKRANKPLKVFAFNPNTVSQAELISMGLSAHIAQQWLRYREKGGYFSKAEDVRKLYAITDEVYKSLAPYMYFESKASSVDKPEKRKLNTTAKAREYNSDHQEAPMISPEPKLQVRIGINAADSVSLLQVKGIGAYYAGAIVRYRERLGGFVDLAQLKELYKVDEERYALWTQSLFLDTVALRKLPLNTADFKSVLRHPYIDYETTKYILNKRKRLGGFAAPYQLIDEQYLPDSLYQKLLPYLSL